MDFKILKDYIPYLVNMNADNIKSAQLPGQSQYINGISFFLADEGEIDKVVEELFTGTDETTQGNQEQNNTIE